MELDSCPVKCKHSLTVCGTKCWYIIQSYKIPFMMWLTTLTIMNLTLAKWLTERLKLSITKKGCLIKTYFPLEECWNILHYRGHLLYCPLSLYAPTIVCNSTPQYIACWNLFASTLFQRNSPVKWLPLRHCGDLSWKYYHFK